MNIEGDDLDLEAELNAVLDGENPLAQEQQQEQEAAPEGEAAAEEQAREYARDEAGRFTQAQKDDAAAAQQAQQQAPPAPKQAWKPLWYKDEFGNWDQLSEPLRKALEQRETEAAQAITKHSTAAKAWEPVNQALAPHLQELAAMGSSPQQYVGQLIEADKYLRADPVQAINWLVGQYIGQGYDIRALADWMDSNNVQTQKVDPVQQELTALKQQLAALQSAPQRQFQESVRTTITEWSKDKPHYAAVESLIAGMIQSDPSHKERYRVDPKATLDFLYEQACFAHPQIRESILADRAKAAEDQRLAELKRARAAGAQSPRGGQTNGALKNQRPTMSLEDEIAMHLDGGV